MRAMNAAIRLLAADSRDEIARHLRNLSLEERTPRFGAPLDDHAVGRYAAGLDFARDRVLGVIEEDGALVGVAHLGLGAHGYAARLGVSVAAGSRCRGYGYALLCVAALQARRAGRSRLFMPGLSQSPVLTHLARKAGFSVIDEFGRPCNWLGLSGVPELPAAPAPRRVSARKARALVLGALLPFFVLDLALMLAVSSACHGCQPAQRLVSER
jgi:GNAT superfamily N-acetyltransferase